MNYYEQCIIYLFFDFFCLHLDILCSHISFRKKENILFWLRKKTKYPLNTNVGAQKIHLYMGQNNYSFS
jgi:hypothetical protein